MTKKSAELSVEQIVAGFGSKVGFFINNLNLSDDARQLLIELLAGMSPEQVASFAEVLEERLAVEQSDILEIELANKLESLAIRYAAEEDKIDRESIAQLSEFSRQQELDDLRQSINK